MVPLRQCSVAPHNLSSNSKYNINKDPASSVLSFKGRCYLLIQIQTPYGIGGQLLLTANFKVT